MPECVGCSWFREVTPSTSRVGMLRSLVQSTHAEVEQELNRIEAEEFGKFQAEDQEVRLKTARAQYLLGEIGGDFNTCGVPREISDEHLERTVAAFPVRFEGKPQCVTHCAQKAASHLWFIPSLRNWAHFCSVSLPRLPASDCRQCAHYLAPTGDADDAREVVTLTNALGETDSEAAPILLSRKSVVEQKIGPHKASDLALAYNGDGRVPSRLRYLPFCSKHSAVPQLWNRFGDCQSFVAAENAAGMPAQESSVGAQRPAFSRARIEEWTQQAAAPTASSAALPPMPMQSNDTGRATTMASMGASPFAPALAAGRAGRSTTALSSSAQDLVGILFDQIRSRLSGALAQSLSAAAPAAEFRVLVPGDPPLTEEMLRRSAEVAAAAFASPFSPEDDRRYRGLTVEAWSRNVKPAIDAQLALIAEYDALRAGVLDRHQAARQLQAFLTACGVAPGSGPDRPREDRRSSCVAPGSDSASSRDCALVGRDVESTLMKSGNDEHRS